MVPGLTWVSPNNGISIGSPVFAQLTVIPNTRTDIQTTLRTTSVAIGQIYMLCVQAMRPKNQGDDAIRSSDTQYAKQHGTQHGIYALEIL